MNIGERLAELRKDSGYKQKDLAQYLGVGVSTISNYETDTHEPDLDSLCLLADFYHVSTDYLLGRTDIAITISSLDEPVYQDMTKAELLYIMDQLTKTDYQYLVRTLRMLHYQHELEKFMANAKEMEPEEPEPPKKKRGRKRTRNVQ